MQQLIATAPRTLVWTDYTDRPISADEVLIRVTHASPKHGSEIADFRGNSPLIDEKYGPDWHLLTPRGADEQPGVVLGQWNVGNMVVGIIEQCGPDVVDYQPGDWVLTYSSIRKTCIAKAIQPPPSAKTPRRWGLNCKILVSQWSFTTHHWLSFNGLKTINGYS